MKMPKDEIINYWLASSMKDFKAMKSLFENGVDVWRMYLFGSYASGTFNEESDIDLAIFLKKEDIDGFSDDVKLMHLRRNVDLRIEPHAFAMSDFEEPDCRRV